MSVYFAPSNKYSANVWTGNGGVLDTIGKLLIDPMIARDTAARQYKYQNQLAADAAVRAQAATDAQNARQDLLIKQMNDYVAQNPGAIQGTGGTLGTFLALGGKGDLAQMAPYYLSTPQSVNTGDQIITRQVNPNGTAMDENSYKVGMSPKDEGALALAQQQAAYQEWLGKQELGLKQKALSIQAANSARAASAGRQHAAQLMPDGKGGMVWVDPYSRTVTPAQGMTALSNGGTNRLETVKTLADIYSKLHPKQGSGGGLGLNLNTDGTAAAATANVDPLEALIYSYLGVGGQQPGMPSAPNNSLPQSDTKPQQSTGSGRNFITTEELQAEAAKNKMSLEQATKAAQKAGLKIIRSNF